MNKDLQDLIATIRISPGSDLYRSRWGSATTFEALPSISRDDLMATPLSHRRYKEARSLVKIVPIGTAAFLSEWAFEDIGLEEFGFVTTRPLVYMSDPHDAIEKSMWCYEKGVVPLIGEADPDLAAYAAKKYRIDGLVTDPSALTRFAPHLEKLEAPLSSITIISDTFDPAALLGFARFAKRVRLTLALPETGAIAQADLSASPVFEPVARCLVGQEAGSVIVTKSLLLVTPIIKYRTAISSSLFV